MFWNNKILEEKKEETLENRIIDLINLNSTKINIWYNRLFEAIAWWKTYFDDCWTLSIQTKKEDFCIGYMFHKYDWINRIVLFEDENIANDIELDISMANKIKQAAEERIKRDFIKKLFPVDPEITKIMSDVEEIQDSKEQVDYILNRIQWIKSKY